MVKTLTPGGYVVSPEVRAELLRLLAALCDGEPTAPEHARLEELLDADAECRRVYLEYLDMHARLLVHGDLGQGRTPVPPPAPAVLPLRRWGVRLLRYAAAAALGAAAVLLLQLSAPPAPELPPAAPTEPARYIATLAHADHCTWEDAREARATGARLLPGELRLREGVLQVRFDSGPDLLIAGPAHVRLDSASSATVLRGQVLFRGDETAATFDLHTPASHLEDLGTEYAVRVGPEGEEIHVFDGEVRRLSRTRAAEHLKAGEARRYAGPDHPGEPTVLARDTFPLAPPPHVPDPAAGLLAYEGFAYDDAQALPGGTAAGGVGWLGPWVPGFVRPRDEGAEARLVLSPSAGLSRPGAAVPAVGGAVAFTGFTKCYRRLATPLRLDTDGVYYLSYLFRRQGPSPDVVNAVAVLFWTDEQFAQEQRVVATDPRQRLNVGVGGPNELFTHLQGHGARTPLPLSYGETYLLVAKIVAGRTNPDQVFLRVYAPTEPVEAQEPGNWSVVGPSFQSDLVFDWLQVHVNSQTRQTLDEIRLGTTWAAVTAPWRGPERP